MKQIESFLEAFRQYVQEANSILITSHISPDDDSISSTLGVKHWIEKHYPSKKVQIVYESEVHKRWSVFKGFDDITSDQLIETHLTEAIDLVICTDVNQYGRVTNNPKCLVAFNKPKICIDHHKSQPDSWDLEIIDVEASSTAEIIYKLFYQEKDVDFAKILLLGILGDTGNLRFIDYTQVHVYDIVKHLVQAAQVNIQSFKASYDYYANESIEVAKILIANQKTQSIGDWPIGNTSYLTRNDFEKYDLIHIKEGVNLYTVTFSRLQKEVSWSIVLYPSKGKIKVSSRSQPGSINVRKLMEALKIGSGHDYAAGGTWEGENLQAEDKLEELLQWLKTHKPLID